MVSEAAIIGGIGSVILCVALSFCFIYRSVISSRRQINRRNDRQRQMLARRQRHQRRILNRRRAQQEQNIYNISGRVPNSNSAQYPDAYLSVEHIAITNELNKPPKYDDAPPSYEEALKLALAQSNSLQTFQAEQPQVHQAASSTSSSTPVVVSAIPSRTTE